VVKMAELGSRGCPPKAGFPAPIAWINSPKAKTSVRGSASFPSYCSGAMYWNVPTSMPRWSASTAPWSFPSEPPRSRTLGYLCAPHAVRHAGCHSRGRARRTMNLDEIVSK
jgi:hypothetical protein